MDIAQAERIFREQIFCVLATSTLDGSPWVSPVFFNYDHSYRLVWESARDALHSQLIVHNPRIAVVVANFIPDGTDEAVYLDCLASEVPVARLSEVLNVFLDGPHKKDDSIERKVEDYMGDKPLRLYEAVPQRAYAMVVTHDAEGHRLDRRSEIELRKMMAEGPRALRP